MSAARPGPAGRRHRALIIGGSIGGLFAAHFLKRAGWDAVIFERSCGATTDFSTQVSVLPSGDLPKTIGNVFVADADHGKAPRAPWGGPDVSVRWLAPNILELTYDSRARVFAQVPAIDGTTLVYVQRPSTSRP